MPPLLLSITDRGDGRSVAVVSVRPGRRVQLVVPNDLLTDDDAAAIVGVLVQLTERKGTP